MASTEQRAQIYARYPAALIASSGDPVAAIILVAGAVVEQYSEGIFGPSVMMDQRSVYDELRTMGLADPDFSILEEVYGIH